MSGNLQAALITPERATKLLDEIVFERVLGFVDLDGLFGFEQELWCALAECGLDDDAIAEASKAMIDRALARIAEDPRRYGTFGPAPGGFDCPDCIEEARVNAKRRA
ncbi:MAG: hypothetical protein HOV81_32555 [Kofleriaceae bacterium]|nr:hypothetical protein [Kofleriaceae bacterium]